MSDILFHFLVMARRRDQSLLRRLFFADEPLLESGVEQLVESAAARVLVTSQHERTRQKTVTVPESRHRGVRFYQAPEPNRPTPGHLERRSESFPLSKTLDIDRCRICAGRGRVECGSCFGRGQGQCRSCNGSGQLSGKRGHYTCGTCGGQGARACRSCQGSGLRPCRPCDGEGKMASWQEVVYDYRLETRTADRFPLAKPSHKLRKAIAAWFRKNTDEVAEFEPRAVAEHLGYATPQALEVAAGAEQDRLRLEGEARAARDSYLFHKTTRSLSPVGYSVMRRACHAAYYWLVGHGEKAREITPTGRLDWRKLLGWLSLGPWAAFGYQGLLQAYGLSGLLWDLPILAEWSLMSLALGVAVSGGLMFSGFRRCLARPPLVETLGIFHPSGEPTSMLACLAYLGSYTGRLSVVDRAYTTQTERLLGTPRPIHRSETLAIELADGRKAYLIEVARPQELSDGELKGLLEALDGALMLQETGLQETGLQDTGLQDTGLQDAASRLESRLRSLGHESLRISSARFDRDPAADLENSPDLPLEALRTTFLGHFQADIDWHKLFENLWQPVRQALKGGDPTQRPSTSCEIANQVSPIENHEPAVEVQEPAVADAPSGLDEGADPRSRGLWEELPHRHPGPIHLAS